MGRAVAVIWHASFSFVAAVLYFFFVLPRWWELTGYTPHLLGTVLRIVAAVLIGVAALPVVFTLLRIRKPECDAPQLALTLLTWSTVAHVLAGLLIAGTAISEIWLALATAGQWQFGVYGAAAAIALLGIGAFYLSFIAELPAPPPKPAKPAKAKKLRRRLRRRGKDSEETVVQTPEGAAETDEADEVAAAEPGETVTGAEPAEVETAATDVETESVELTEPTTATERSDTELVSTGSQEKRRPSGKRRAKNRG